MSSLPCGLAALDPVALPRTAVAGSDFHRPSEVDTVTGCGRDLVALRLVDAVLAVGLGCVPCVGCWPPTAVPTPTTGPQLRPAVPWPDNGAGYRSRLDRADLGPVRSSSPAARR